MKLTVTEVELKRIFRDIWQLGIQTGMENTLSKLGLLSEWVRKSEAIKMLGSEETYRKAVAKGMLHERKVGNGKNSPIVVSREEINYINTICLPPNF